MTQSTTVKPVYKGPVYYGYWTTSQNFQLPYIFWKVDLYITAGLSKRFKVPRKSEKVAGTGARGPPPGEGSRGRSSLGICVPLPGKHISLVKCLSPTQLHIFLVIWNPLAGKHTSLVICVSRVEEQILQGICVSQVGEHISQGTFFRFFSIIYRRQKPQSCRR